MGTITVCGTGYIDRRNSYIECRPREGRIVWGFGFGDGVLAAWIDGKLDSARADEARSEQLAGREVHATLSSNRFIRADMADTLNRGGGGNGPAAVAAV